MQNNYLFESPWWPRAFLEMALKYIHEVHYWRRDSGGNGNWIFLLNMLRDNVANLAFVNFRTCQNANCTLSIILPVHPAIFNLLFLFRLLLHLLSPKFLSLSGQI